MADIEITVDGGTSKRLLTGGKYCDRNITVTATGGGAEPEPPDDGKTRLYITVPANSMPDRPPPRNEVPLYIQQSVANGVTIDWGDGSAPETLPGTGKVNTTHTYDKAGDYVISLDPAEDCKLGFGENSVSTCILGPVSDNNRVYMGMLSKVHIGKNVQEIGMASFIYCNSLTHVFMDSSVKSIGNYSFRYCESLKTVNAPKELLEIGTSAFEDCKSLSLINFPDNLLEIKKYAFRSCYSFSSMVIPEKVSSIYEYAFGSCYGVKEYHFLPPTPPSLANVNSFNLIPSDCVIYVPVGSLEAYQTATNWSAFADQIQEEPA